MAKMVYNEWFGELTFALNAALKKNNVSPSDYRELEDEFGEGNYDAILRAVKERSKEHGYYRNDRSLVVW